jgi:hypothetical protein
MHSNFSLIFKPFALKFENVNLEILKDGCRSAMSKEGGIEMSLDKVSEWYYQGILKGEVSLFHWPPVW